MSQLSSKTKTNLVVPEQRWEPDGIPMVLVIRQLSGAARGRVTLLDSQASLLLGRDPQCQLNITDDVVSRRHAEIRVLSKDGEMPSAMVRDLQSSNGTRIDGSRLEGGVEQVWLVGQTLEVGAGIHFRLSFMRRDDAEAIQQAFNSPHRDGATGLLSREGLLEALGRETHHLLRHPHESIAIILIRLFDFSSERAPTDSDQILRNWVGAIEGVVRADAILGRSSKDDIALVLRHCDVLGARAAMLRFRQAIVGQPNFTGNCEPAVGALLVSGKYHPEAPKVLQFAERQVFKFGYPGDDLKLLEYTPATSANSKTR